jgi:hypothetical protein
MNMEHIAESLFRKYYNLTQSNITPQNVLNFRKARFINDEYWAIWKKYGEFFGFLEGFFHKTDGTNQLYKIPENEKFLFQFPQNIVDNFKSDKDLALYLQKHNIKRMVNENARNLILASTELYEANTILKPKNLEELMKYRGYGRKIANMVMNVVFDIPRIAVDVRVFRAGVNLGLLPKEFLNQHNKDKFKIKAEMILNEMFKDSKFLIEMDYLLFQEGGK